MSRMSSVSAFALIAIVGLAGCQRGAPVEHPPMQSQQTGYRGTGMVQINNPRLVAARNTLQIVPDAPPPVPSDGPKARDVYQNVKVLGDVSAAEFVRTMASLTAWVSPKEGCAYCHNLPNLADDGKYTKVVARRMLQMTQHLNADWKPHVVATGVTCWTCHRGNPVPANVWFKAGDGRQGNPMLGGDGGQNKAAESVGLASLPYDPFTPYLADNKAMADIRVEGPTALPTSNRHSTKQAEHTYALMMHLSGSLGVNCTFCHNTHSFQSWDAPPQRAKAWYGLRMVGDLNANYLTPLTPVFPATRLGITGDVAKVNCATCHQGVNKPLNGATMAKDYPALVQAPDVKLVAALASPDGAAPFVDGVLGKVLFDSGKSVLGESAKGAISAAAKLMSGRADVKVALSGYADRTGAVDANVELARQRAKAVRDALQAAGVGVERIALKKPEFVVGDASGESRRVDIVATH